MSERSRRGTVAALADAGGRIVCERCEIADSLVSRVRGLLGRSSLEQGSGMLITRTSSIHTFFMAFPIDAVFLGRDLRVRSVAGNVRPFRIVFRVGSRNVLELPAGEAARAGILKGSRLSWQDPAAAPVPAGQKDGR